MYKRVIGFMLTLCMIFGLITCIHAENSLPYRVGNLYFSDIMGNKITNPEKSCLVNVTVTKTEYRSEMDSIILTAFATDGTLIGFSMMRATMPTGADTEFAALMNFQGKTLGKVKAYVWDNIAGMKALSNVCTVEVNEPIRPLVIPESITLEGIVVDTSRTLYNLGKNQVNFLVQDVDDGLDFDSCVTVDEYNQLQKLRDVIQDKFEFFYKSIGSYLTLDSKDVNLNDFIGAYVSLEVYADKNDIIHVERIVNVRENTIVSLATSLFDKEANLIENVYDDEYLTADNPYIKYFTSIEKTNSLKVKLDDGFKVYVNGVPVENNKTNFEKYIFKNPGGRVRFVDICTKGNLPDGKYDIVNVDYFETAQVEYATSNKIVFSDSTANVSNLKLDTYNNEDLEYHIYYNGEEIAISELMNDDVLSIAYDVTAGFADSNFFDIYVSRDIKSGVYMGKNYDDEEIIIDGENYRFVYLSDSETFFEKSSGLTMGSEYDIYLDSTGRIWKMDMVASNEKLAIIDKYCYSDSCDNKVGLFYFPDGTYKIIEIDYKKCGFGSESEIAEFVYIGGKEGNSNKKPIEDRIVQYKISSTTNKIISLEFKTGTGTTAEYNARTNAVGAVRMNSKTNIIDATKYYAKQVISDPVSYQALAKSSLSELVDDIEYTVYGYGTKNSDGTYPFVLVLECMNVYTEDTKFAVVTEKLKPTTNDNGDEGYLVRTLYEGESTELFVSDIAKVDGSVITDTNYSYILERGDIVVFRKNINDDVDKIDNIFNVESIDFSDYKNMVRSVFKARSFKDFVIIPDNAKYWSDEWDNYGINNTSIVFGIIVDREKNRLYACAFFSLQPKNAHGQKKHLSFLPATGVHQGCFLI